MRIPLPTWLRVPVATVLLIASTVLHVTPLFVIALIKACVPVHAIRGVCDRALMAIAESWIGFNSAMIRTLTRLRFSVEIDATLRYDGHYLVLANHQSWVDIPVLQAIFNRRIPLLRFFLKSQLFWVPLLGLAWWALDFPFMKRYSKETLAKHPELAGRDIEATRRACEKFRHIPVSVMNFVEGTRLTPAKHRQQESPFLYLLRPKAGGVAFVINALGDALQSVLDVTIVYPEGRSTLKDLFADRIPEVRVHIRELPIPAALAVGSYENDPAVREQAQQWINELWSQKDARIAAMRADGRTGQRAG
ncbi:MAG TPA: acyltransferase [Povalibacter sp.]|uniref:acyltransferase n=1 Tax=Povalibacter sp. TaxID=1962978 RepID=UPI002B74ABEB|nr:acyltransferase [Povalibacter sp.]HMN45572.1 acyltransferase [Povalibacter sp.]